MLKLEFHGDFHTPFPNWSQVSDISDSHSTNRGADSEGPSYIEPALVGMTIKTARFRKMLEHVGTNIFISQYQSLNHLFSGILMYEMWLLAGHPGHPGHPGLPGQHLKPRGFSEQTHFGGVELGLRWLCGVRNSKFWSDSCDLKISLSFKLPDFPVDFLLPLRRYTHSCEKLHVLAQQGGNIARCQVFIIDGITVQHFLPSGEKHPSPMIPSSHRPIVPSSHVILEVPRGCRSTWAQWAIFHHSHSAPYPKRYNTMDKNDDVVM